MTRAETEVTESNGEFRCGPVRVIGYGSSCWIEYGQRYIQVKSPDDALALIRALGKWHESLLARGAPHGRGPGGGR